MEWKIFWATFVTIFVAEIGDKTQFAAMAASAQSKKVLPVLLATILALSLAGSIGVLAGKLLGSFLNPEKMKYLSGALFILMGTWMIFKK